MEATKVTIQYGARILSVEGSEAFVEKAIGLWDKYLTGPLPAVTADGDTVADSSKIDNGVGLLRASEGLNLYDNVFDVADGKIKIISVLPGKTKAEKTRQVALLMLFGHFLLKNELVASEVIRNSCVDQGCYDSTNFAGYIKSLKSSVVMNTKAGGQYDIKLTAPGRKAARELADNLQEAAA